MRLRNKQWVDEYLKNHPENLINFETKPNWKKLFPKQQPLFLEIGCGKGGFIIQHAQKHPQNNYLGLEKEKTVVGVALKKMFTESNDSGITNLRFSQQFAENINDFFPDEVVDHLYLNFSDPWPKAKHAKKRLTYRTFLERYWNLLKPTGILEFKTDNDKLFAFTLEEVNSFHGFEIVDSTTDLYNHKELLKDNIPTEYETKFHNQGKNINKLILRKIEK